MTALRERMIEDMGLHGLSPHTERAYVQAVRGLAEYYHKSPEQVGEEKLRRYFLYLIEEKKLSRSSCTVARYAIRYMPLLPTMLQAGDQAIGHRNLTHSLLDGLDIIGYAAEFPGQVFDV